MIFFQWALVGKFLGVEAARLAQKSCCSASQPAWGNRWPPATTFAPKLTAESGETTMASVLARLSSSWSSQGLGQLGCDAVTLLHKLPLSEPSGTSTILLTPAVNWGRALRAGLSLLRSTLPELTAEAEWEELETRASCRWLVISPGRKSSLRNRHCVFLQQPLLELYEARA